MATPAEKLLALSPLSSGTPAEHLCAITAGGSAVITGTIEDVPPITGETAEVGGVDDV